MKKSFWMRLIIFVAVFMITINGILPTNVVFADNADPNSSSATKESDDDTASAFERIICGLLLTLGTSIYLLVRLVIGQPFSIDKAIFNEYSNTKLSFFVVHMLLLNILVSGNLDSGILETDIPEDGNSLIGLFTTYQVVRYCQAQSRFAVL